MERVFVFSATPSGRTSASANQIGEESMRFGIIGAGRIGKIHGANIAARADSQVRFVADADAGAAQSLAQATGGSVASIAAIIASPEIDAVAICAPTDMHADLIEEAA